MLPGAGTRSLGTIADVNIQGVDIDNYKGRRKFRLTFTDASGKTYLNLPINDLTFRQYLQNLIDTLDNETRAERASMEALLSFDRIYLRIGLARPYSIPNYPFACWRQITGIYTFPDYLGGKTFGDF